MNAFGETELGSVEGSVLHEMPAVFAGNKNFALLCSENPPSRGANERETLQHDEIKPMMKQYGERAELEELVVLIREIWREFYTSLIGAAQVEYMLEQFQSVEAMMRQIAEEDFRYYGVFCDGELAGYYAAKPCRNDGVFLSKFYVAARFRGRGLGKEMLRHLIDAARAAGADAIRLTVNKHNPTVAIYRKLGFDITEEIVADIGNGYVMDDYVMVKRIGPIVA